MNVLGFAMKARFGDYEFDGERRRLTRDGSALALTPKAFALLETLVEASPAALSKEALYETLWPGVFVEMGNLYTLVAEIRSAAGDESLIRTVHRFGYALGADIESEPPVAAYLLVGNSAIPLRQGENVIGRDLLNKPDVSRRHARFVISGQSATVEDLGSKNGTWMKGQRIASRQAVANGDALTFGLTSATLMLTPGDDTITADPPALT